MKVAKNSMIIFSNESLVFVMKLEFVWKIYYLVSTYRTQELFEILSFKSINCLSESFRFANWYIYPVFFNVTSEVTKNILEQQGFKTFWKIKPFITTKRDYIKLHHEVFWEFLIDFFLLILLHLLSMKL